MQQSALEVLELMACKRTPDTLQERVRFTCRDLLWRLLELVALERKPDTLLK